MGEIKTKQTDLDVDTFLMSIEPAKKRMDCIEFETIVLQ
jgi:hypothetical protein